MEKGKVLIDVNLAQCLVAKQFPQWRHLPIWPVAEQGWDNRTFHLGEEMLIRLPSASEYAKQVEKEQYWLPKLAPSLPLEIPTPIAMGAPGDAYPWKWSIYRWLIGETAATSQITDLCAFAENLAQFCRVLQSIDTTGGPLPGPDNFYRGGSLQNYDVQTREAINLLQGQIDTAAALQIWKTALAHEWSRSTVWVHGDLSPNNLLVKDEKLCAIIDFGQLAIGDPACDLAIAWTFFKGESRKVFQANLSLDEATWVRGQAWALWKALIIAAGLVDGNPNDNAKASAMIEEILLKGQ